LVGLVHCMHAEFNEFGTLLSEMKLTLSTEVKGYACMACSKKTLFEMEGEEAVRKVISVIESGKPIFFAQHYIKEGHVGAHKSTFATLKQ
jgi:hypothetical protein